MSLWDRFRRQAVSAPDETVKYAIVDAEVGITDHKVHDIGALRFDGAYFHKASKQELKVFLKGADYICGHNIVHHDAKYLFEEGNPRGILVDTLYLSPLLFPERPYHRLVKDDKLITEQMNNPINDCEKARDLLWDEITRWNYLSPQLQQLYSSLLSKQIEFDGFLKMVKAPSPDLRKLPGQIRVLYEGIICSHADIESIIARWPVALAYALAVIATDDERSNTPAWVIRNYPEIASILRLLRHTRCPEGCPYCNAELDVHLKLKHFFGYDSFRLFEGENLQERAAQAAVDGRSLLAIFPTGGRKIPYLPIARTYAGTCRQRADGCHIASPVTDEGSG